MERILFRTLTKKTENTESHKIFIDFELQSSQGLLGAKARKVMNCMEIVAVAKTGDLSNIAGSSLRTALKTLRNAAKVLVFIFLSFFQTSR